jgi:hypothetical protein
VRTARDGRGLEQARVAGSVHRPRKGARQRRQAGARLYMRARGGAHHRSRRHPAAPAPPAATHQRASSRTAG